MMKEKKRIRENSVVQENKLDYNDKKIMVYEVIFREVLVQ